MSHSRRGTQARTHRPAFSLVELVMVVVILGIVSAIAVPRMTTATTRASAGALRGTLSSVRTAIDCYYAEHSRYPGYTPATGAPDGNEFVKQLTLFSDPFGKTNATPNATYRFGPYLRAPFPTNPMNKLSNVFVKADPGAGDPADGTHGWVTDLTHGYFGVSATDTELNNFGLENAAEKANVRAKIP